MLIFFFIFSSLKFRNVYDYGQIYGLVCHPIAVTRPKALIQNKKKSTIDIK